MAATAAMTTVKIIIRKFEEISLTYGRTEHKKLIAMDPTTTNAMGRKALEAGTMTEINMA